MAPGGVAATGRITLTPYLCGAGAILCWASLAAAILGAAALGGGSLRGMSATQPARHD